MEKIATRSAPVALAGYDIVTAAQAAAFFARKAGGSINVLKLTKLLYLSEREYMARFDEPMFYDRLVSMDYGPVTSTTLNLINGMIDDERWSKFMGDRSGHNVNAARHDDTFNDLDHLSKSERKVLEEIWDKFSQVDRFDLAEWTHKNIPEWEHPNGSSREIRHEIVFKFLGKKNSSELNASIKAHRRFKQALGVEN